MDLDPPNFSDSEYFNSSDAEYVKKYDLDTLYTHPFENETGKYISVVTSYEDGSPKEVDASFGRYKLRLTYIKESKDIKEILITKYKYNRKGEFVLENTEGLRLPNLSYSKIIGFLKFLSTLDLPSIDERKLRIAPKDLDVNDSTVQYLKTFFATDKGRGLLAHLYDQGLLKSTADIPELIRKGLSHEKIEEKLEAISEFERLIEKTDLREVGDVQRALERIPWIFGPEYKSLDVRTAGKEGIPDRRLKRIDGLSDILEIKLPSEELFRSDKLGRQFITPKLAESIGQLTGYLEYYYSEYRIQTDDQSTQEILTDTYNNYYRPKGFLLIGRRKTTDGVGTKNTIDADPKRLRRLMAYTHWIEVITYDDLIERARNGVNNLLKN